MTRRDILLARRADAQLIADNAINCAISFSGGPIRYIESPERRASRRRVVDAAITLVTRRAVGAPTDALARAEKGVASAAATYARAARAATEHYYATQWPAPPSGDHWPTTT